MDHDPLRPFQGAPRSRSRGRLILLAAGLAVVLAGVAAWRIVVGGTTSEPLSQSVVLSVTVTADNGGVFIDDVGCAPRVRYMYVGKALRIQGEDGTDRDIPINGLTRASADSCLIEVVAELMPEVAYQVSLGTSLLGEINPASRVSGSATFLHRIAVERKLSGYLDIYQPASDCYKENSGIFICGWVKLLSEGGCEGYGAYADMTWGTLVSIYSSEGLAVGQTELTSSGWSRPATNKKAVLCRLNWDITVPNDDKGYYVQMTESRGRVFFSKEELTRPLATVLD